MDKVEILKLTWGQQTNNNSFQVETNWNHKYVTKRSLDETTNWHKMWQKCFIGISKYSYNECQSMSYESMNEELLFCITSNAFPTSWRNHYHVDVVMVVRVVPTLCRNGNERNCCKQWYLVVPISLCGTPCPAQGIPCAGQNNAFVLMSGFQKRLNQNWRTTKCKSTKNAKALKVVIRAHSMGALWRSVRNWFRLRFSQRLKQRLRQRLTQRQRLSVLLSPSLSASLSALLNGFWVNPDWRNHWGRKPWVWDPRTVLELSPNSPRAAHQVCEFAGVKLNRMLTTASISTLVDQLHFRWIFDSRGGFGGRLRGEASGTTSGKTKLKITNYYI